MSLKENKVQFRKKNATCLFHCHPFILMKDGPFNITLMHYSLWKRNRRDKHKTHLEKYLSRTHAVP